VYLISLTVLLTGLLLLGLLRREKYGVANIGFESLLIMILYLTSFTFLAFD
jgi:cation:H+ antiporter